jgi:hypothetical protein
MDPILEAESVVAVKGIPSALADSPKAPTDADLSKAAKLDKRIATRVRELLNARQPAKQLGPPELPDYRETHAQLVDGINGDELAEMLLTVPQPLQPGCSAVWTQAAAYLNSVFPRRTADTMTGPRLYDPSPGEWAEFGWAWRVATTPLVVLDLMADGMLVGAEVAHLKAMFPAIHSAIGGELADAIAEHAAKDDQWLPPWWLQKQICTLLGVSPVSKTLLADIETALQSSKQQSEQRTHDVQMKAQTETQTQRLAGK